MAAVFLDSLPAVWASAFDAARKAAGAPFPVKHFHSASRSLQRVPGGAQMIGLSVAQGRMMFTLGELTGNIWLQERTR